MTINVQATRQSTAETAPGRKDYEEKDDRRRRFVPLFFLLFVGSCTAYLKSFLPVKLEAAEDRGQARSAPAEEETVKEDVLAAADEPEPEQPAAAGDDKDEEVAVALHDEAAAASAATDFSAQARTEKPKLDIGSGESPKVANDNRPTPRQEARRRRRRRWWWWRRRGRRWRRQPPHSARPAGTRSPQPRPPRFGAPCIFPTPSPATGWRYRWRRFWPAPPIPTATA